MNILRRKVIPARPERIETEIDFTDEAGWSIRSKDGYLSMFMPGWSGPNQRVFTPDDLREAARRAIQLADRIEEESR